MKVVNIQSRVVYAVFFYVLLMTLMMVAKPAVLFDEEGNIRPFGVGGGEKTMFSLGVLTVVVAVFSFYTFCIIDLVFK